jgi:hypothetical protein
LEAAYLSFEVKKKLVGDSFKFLSIIRGTTILPP